MKQAIVYPFGKIPFYFDFVQYKTSTSLNTGSNFVNTNG